MFMVPCPAGSKCRTKSTYHRSDSGRLAECRALATRQQSGSNQIAPSSQQKPVRSMSKTGDHKWRLNGKLHRTDGPAVQLSNGTTEWYFKGKRHRDNGLPAIETRTGRKEYWVNGKRHREDGPAIETRTGRKEYWVNGEFVRSEDPIAEQPKPVIHDPEILARVADMHTSKNSARLHIDALLALSNQDSAELKRLQNLVELDISNMDDNQLQSAWEQSVDIFSNYQSEEAQSSGEWKDTVAYHFHEASLSASEVLGYVVELRGMKKGAEDPAVIEQINLALSEF